MDHVKIIFNHLVEIKNINIGGGIINTRYNYKYISSKIIKKAINKFSLNWGYTIIQSEFIEALWEGIIKARLKFLKDMDYIISNLNTEDVIVKTFFKYLEITILNTMTKHLMPSNNKKQILVNGKYINEYLYINEINFTDFNEDYNFIENLFLNTSSLFDVINSTIDQNYFFSWFEKNKENILTRKQQDFINNYGEYDRKQKYKYTQNIAKRIVKLFLKKYGTKDLRIIELQEKINLLDNIIYAANIATLKIFMKEQYVADLIYNNMNLEECKKIVKMYNGEECYIDKKLLQKIFNNIIKESIKLEKYLNKYKKGEKKGTSKDINKIEAC